MSNNNKIINEEYSHKVDNAEYKRLSKKDKAIIDKIDLLLKELSARGRIYWGNYYS